jgi:hypothetical protein
MPDLISHKVAKMFFFVTVTCVTEDNTSRQSRDGVQQSNTAVFEITISLLKLSWRVLFVDGSIPTESIDMFRSECPDCSTVSLKIFSQ